MVFYLMKRLADGSQLDGYDRRILSELQRDGRIKNQALAELVGLSAAACWRRVKTLEDAGIIRRYTALVDPAALGQGLCVLVMVSLTRHGVDSNVEFEQAVRDWPEVLECYAVTGNADFMLRVVIPDMSAYDAFLTHKLFSLTGISQVNSNFTLREVKQDTAIPL